MNKWKVVKKDTGEEIDLDRQKSNPIVKSTFTKTGKAKIVAKQPKIPPYIPETLLGGWVFSGVYLPKTMRGSERWYYLSDEHPNHTLILAPDHKFVVVKGRDSGHFNPSMRGKATFLMSPEERGMMLAAIEKAKKEDITFWWKGQKDEFEYEEDPDDQRWSNGEIWSLGTI